MDLYQTIINSGIPGGILSGIYATIVFIIMLRFVPVKKNLAEIGIFNKWIVLVFLIFTFGFLKHEVGYFLQIESSYCKNTEVCDKLVKIQPISLDQVKDTVGFLENIWLESIGEGIAFVLVGLPSFVFIKNKLIAAFITGIFGHLFSKYSGFHGYFCRTTCSANPIATSKTR